MSRRPPAEVVRAFESGTTKAIRRIEVCEADGATLWNPDITNDPDFSRMIGGNVTVDSNRDERRALDMVLMNADKLLRPDPNNGFWYDKIIKPYRGIRYPVDATAPILSITEGDDAGYFESIVKSLGYTNTESRPSGVIYADYDHADILVAATGDTSQVTKLGILRSHYDGGGAVLTFGTANGIDEVPHITGVSNTATAVVWGVTPVSSDTPLSGSFVTQASGVTAVGDRPTSLAAGAVAVSSWINGAGPTFITGSITWNQNGGRWFDLHLPSLDTVEIRKLLVAGLRWLSDYQPYKEWEVQMGEFIVDGINDKHFPHQVSITARDYVKKCLDSKFTRTTAYSASDSATETVRALASNSGLTKVAIPEISRQLGTIMSYEPDTPRWTPMKEIMNSFGYEIYVTHDGYMTARRYQDPFLSPTTHEFKTGREGNLVSFDRSLSSVNLFNHLAVYAANTDAGGLPFFGEAKNTDPNSPTRIAKIGDRYVKLDLNYLTSDAECKSRAEELLKTYALESYSMNMSSIYYPWLDAGDIVSLLDPDRLAHEPTRYLMDTLAFPLGLGPMGATTKRITYVGDPGGS